MQNCEKDSCTVSGESDLKQFTYIYHCEKAKQIVVYVQHSKWKYSTYSKNTSRDLSHVQSFSHRVHSNLALAAVVFKRNKTECMHTYQSNYILLTRMTNHSRGTRWRKRSSCDSVNFFRQLLIMNNLMKFEIVASWVTVDYIAPNCGGLFWQRTRMNSGKARNNPTMQMEWVPRVLDMLEAHFLPLYLWLSGKSREQCNKACCDSTMCSAQKEYGWRTWIERGRWWEGNECLDMR